MMVMVAPESSQLLLCQRSIRDLNLRVPRREQVGEVYLDLSLIAVIGKIQSVERIDGVCSKLE